MIITLTGGTWLPIHQEQDEEDDEARVPESNGMPQVLQNMTFNIRMSWKPFQKKKNDQMAEKQDVDDPDMVAYTPDESKEEPFNTAIDNTTEDPTIVMGKPVTTAF